MVFGALFHFFWGGFWSGVFVSAFEVVFGVFFTFLCMVFGAMSFVFVWIFFKQNGKQELLHTASTQTTTKPFRKKTKTVPCQLYLLRRYFRQFFFGVPHERYMLSSGVDPIPSAKALQSHPRPVAQQQGSLAFATPGRFQ